MRWRVLHHAVKPGPGQAALAVALILVAVCALSGCGKEDTSARAMGRYVKKEYGKAELVSEGHEGNTDVYIYKDKEYGFTYQASVRRSRAWFDGPLPWYHTVRDFGLAEVYPAGGHGADLEAACMAVADLYAEKDGRKFWEEGRVTVYDGDACCGYADIRKKGYFSGDAY